LRPQIGNALLGGADGVRASDKPARRWILIRDRKKCLRQLGRIAASDLAGGLSRAASMRPRRRMRITSRRAPFWYSII